MHQLLFKVARQYQCADLTINARVIYKDYVLKKTVFDKQFSAYADYETSGDVSSDRSNAILSAIDLITEDILLAVVSDW